MLYEAEHQVNQAAYERMKEQIDRDYPKGRLVAIGGGKIIADAVNFEVMLEKLQEMGWDPLKTMVLKVGHLQHGMIY